MNDTCALVEAWLFHSPEAANGGLPPGDIVAHLSECSRCRMALIALLADRIGTQTLPRDLDCAAAEQDLPAFVDYERANGLVAAARVFPDVWWHTLVCPDCDELYRALHLLPDAPPPLLRPRPASMPHWPTRELKLELPSALVRQSLMISQHLGAAWGDAEEDTLIAEQQAEIGLLQISLRQQPPDHVALIVRTQPPATGVVLLAIGNASYDCLLDSEGSAIFSGLDQALFSGGAEPIQLTIRPAEKA